MDAIAATDQERPQAAGDGARLPAAGAQGIRPVLPVILPVIFAGLVAVAAALLAFATSDPTPAMLGGVAALLLASSFAEAFPVPLEPAGYVSLTAVFIVGAAVTFGWAPAVLIAFVTGVAVELLQRKPFVRVAYNSCLYAVAGAAAGLAIAVAPQRDAVEILLLEVLVGGLAFYAVNVLLATAAIARWAGQPLLPLLGRNAAENAAPFAIMASVSLMLAVLWQQSPVLIGALIGPLVAVALYQRSVHNAINAMRLALTDAQTGLGNKRQFDELLQRSLDRADETGEPLTLCLIDLDDFKAVNDTHGHPAGDRVLGQVAARLRRGGESFRLGGDEFAILLPGRTAEEGREVAEAVARRIGEAEYDHGGAVSISVGVASYPASGVGRAELVRVADRALYSAKGRGKARVHVYRPDEKLSTASQAPLLAGRAAGLRAAASAAHTVIERDVHIGAHSHNVGELGGRLAQRLGLDPELIELIRVAGGLHDIGKLLVPEDILHKPGPLTPAERSIVERHSEIGQRMLETLGLEPIATWVRHHHERWDGGGYPSRTAGEEIPLPSRILLVADAYDTMTTDRVYRTKVTPAEALAEIERSAGTQFDPAVVAALRDELAETSLALAVPATA